MTWAKSISQNVLLGSEIEKDEKWKFFAFVLMVVLHVTVVHIALELFNLLPVGDQFILLSGLILSWAVVILFLWKIQAFKDIAFWVSLLLPAGIYLLGTTFSPVEYDGLNYHVPKVLLQLTNGNLGLNYGQPFLINSAISFHDNYNMLYLSIFKNLNSLVVGNLIFASFLLYNCSLIFRLIQAGNKSFFLFVMLMLCCPSFIGELYVFKPNVIAPSFWTVCVIGLIFILHQKQCHPSAIFWLMTACFSFLFITKVTVLLALLPLVAFAVYLFCRSIIKDRTVMLLGLVVAALIVILLLGPYLFRQYSFHGPSLYARNNWSFLPPKVDCGAFYWPQHFATIFDYFSQLFGEEIAGNITPDKCSGNPVKFRNTIYFIYPRDFGLILLVIFAFTFKAIRRTPLTDIFFAVALFSPVIHAMFYANSVNNFRLISFIYVIFSAGYALSIARKVKIHQLIIISLLASFTVTSASSINPKQLRSYNVENYDFVLLGELNSKREKVTVRINYTPFLTGIGMIELMEIVDYNWSEVQFFYKNDPLRASERFTHELICENERYPLNAATRDSLGLGQKNIKGCYLVQVNFD